MSETRSRTASTKVAEPNAAGGGETKPAVKKPSHVHAVWKGEQRFDSGRPGEVMQRLDGTGKTGQSPVDALCSAIAACTGIDVVEILAKRRTPVESLDIDVVGERSDGTPRRILGLQLTYRIEGKGIEREHAERAIDLAVNKYCAVRESLARDIEIHWSMTLNGEPFTPGGD